MQINAITAEYRKNDCVAALNSRLNHAEKPIIEHSNATEGSPKRTRVRGKASIAIEVEMQAEQEAQADKAVESAVETSIEADYAMDFGAENERFYSINEWFGLITKCEPNQSELMSTLWIGKKSDSGFQLTKTAFEELLFHRDEFKFGLDQHNLPSGFQFKIAKNGQNVLDFSPRLKALCAYNPLKAQCSAPPSVSPIELGLLEQLLPEDSTDPAKQFLRARWHSLCQNPTYINS